MGKPEFAVIKDATFLENACLGGAMHWGWMLWSMRSNWEMTQMSSCSKWKPSLCQNPVEISAHPLENTSCKLGRSQRFAVWGKACDLGLVTNAQETIEQTGLKLVVWNHRACRVWKRKHKKPEFWNCLSRVSCVAPLITASQHLPDGEYVLSSCQHPHRVPIPILQLGDPSGGAEWYAHWHLGFLWQIKEWSSTFPCPRLIPKPRGILLEMSRRA